MDLGVLKKLFFFLMVFSFMIPAGIMFARSGEKWRMLVFVVMVFSIALPYDMVTVHILPLKTWTGTSRGFQFSTIDILSLILLGSMAGVEKYKIKWFPPGGIFYLMYHLMIVLSGINAIHQLQWGFECARMVNFYLFFVAAYNFMRGYRDFWPLIYAMSAAVLMMFFVGFWQKYFTFRYQISSTMPHQNSLSLFITLFGCVLFGVLLNEIKLNLYQFLLLSAGVCCSLLLILFTFSRGGLICFGMSIALVLVSSLLLNGMTSRRFAITSIAALGALAMVAYAAPRIVQRFSDASPASKATRVNLAKAAVRIANAFPVFGVGANNFCEYSGYARSYAREQNKNLKITDETLKTGGLVETIYLLVAAECGWVGFATLILWLLSYLGKAMSTMFALRKLPLFGLAAGAACALLGNYIQSVLE